VPGRNDILGNHEDVLRVVADHCAETVPPVPAAADRALVIEIGKLAVQGRIILLFAQRQECIAALGDRQPHVAGDLVQILGAAGEAVLQRHRIVDVNQGIDGTDALALRRPLQQRFDRAAVALLLLEFLIRIAPDADDAALTQNIMVQEFLGTDVRLRQQIRDFLLRIFRQGMIVDAFDNDDT